MINKIIFFCITVFALNGCVQKTYKKTVVYLLNTANIKDVKSAGIRGNDKPLNWQSDLVMNADSSGNIYKAIVTYQTGYKFTEAKFLVNNEFEFPEQGNRRIVFSDKDTTIYQAIFNVMK